MKQKLMLILFLLASTSILAQNFVGLNTDNYGGVHGVLINPANVADSRTKIEVNVFGGGVLLSNDYTTVGFSNLLGSKDLDFNNENLNETPNNNGLLTAGILGPSAMFEISEKYSMAVTTRARAFFNVNNLPGGFIQLLDEGINSNQPVTVDNITSSSTAHVWTEYGATFGKVFSGPGRHFLKYYFGL